MKFYTEYYLSRKAERFVNKIWVLDNLQNNRAVENKMVLPNGCFNLAFITGNGIAITIKNKCYNLVRGTYLNAQLTQKSTLTILPHTKVILIQLHAWSLSLLSSFDLTKFKDIVVPINSGDLSFLQNFRPTFYNDVNKVIELTNKFFEKLNDANPEKTRTELMCRNIALENEKIGIAIRDMKYSNRALQIEFKKSTGLTRKQYSKLINLRKSVDYISHPDIESNNLTSIAYKSGYFDQTHFIKIFKEIVNITPKKFESQSFLLAYIR